MSWLMFRSAHEQFARGRPSCHDPISAEERKRWPPDDDYDDLGRPRKPKMSTVDKLILVWMPLFVIAYGIAHVWLKPP